MYICICMFLVYICICMIIYLEMFMYTYVCFHVLHIMYI